MNKKLVKIITALNSNDEDLIEEIYAEECNLENKVSANDLMLYNKLEEQILTFPLDELIEIHNSLNYSIWKRNILLLSISKELSFNNLNSSYELITKLDDMYKFEGYRLILKYYAENANLTEYKKVLKKTDRRQKKYELDNIERSLIFSYSKKHGIDKAIKLISPKKPWLFKIALEAQFGIMKPKDIYKKANQLLNSESVLLIDSHISLIKHLANSKKLDQMLLNQVKEEILKIDKSYRIPKSPFNHRQLSLWQLGSLLLDNDYLEETKDIIKSMSNGKNKKDLSSRLKEKT